VVALWLPGLLVALGAGAVTAHGLFEVAVAAQVPWQIAWLYPLITDGLALVAYVATTRLTGSARRYAWGVVVLAAGLSGLAQAVYLAGGVGVPATAVPTAAGPDAVAEMAAPPVLRFGVGAWPAIAAAIVAHLLFLLGTHCASTIQPATASDAEAVQLGSTPAAVQEAPSVQPVPVNTAVQPDAPVQQPESVQPESDREPGAAGKPGQRAMSALPSPARDRAQAAARRHAACHGSLPTVRELAELAEVSQGSAGTVLKELREQPTRLQIVPETDEARTQP
jgi:hypothetical protein